MLRIVPKMADEERNILEGQGWMRNQEKIYNQKLKNFLSIVN